jgi:hypothetical protein
MRDSDLKPIRTWADKKRLLVGATVAVLLAGFAAWWIAAQKIQTAAPIESPEGSPKIILGTDNSSGSMSSTAAEAATQPIANKPRNSPGFATSLPVNQAVKSVAAPAATSSNMISPQAPLLVDEPSAIKFNLFEQRLAAGKQLIEQKAAVASIQLYYSMAINPERIEGFLQRADKLGVLHEIYLIPTKFGSNDGVRVLYGAYPSIDAARKATGELPKRYGEAFATSIHIF